MAEESKEKDAFFDHFGRESKATAAGAWLVRALAMKIFKFAEPKPGNSVLEIGPGRGDFADICLKQNVDYFAVEANQGMAESLRSRGAQVVSAMVPPLPELDRQFDLVVMINVMEHMNSMADALEITRQIQKVLRPSGRFVVCSPDYLNWRLNFFNCDFSHNYVTTRRRLTQLMINGGFGDVRSCHLCGPASGLLCWIFTPLVGILPFGPLHAMFPGGRIVDKLYKAQLTFSRKVLIVGQKPD